MIFLNWYTFRTYNSKRQAGTKGFSPLLQTLSEAEFDKLVTQSDVTVSKNKSLGRKRALHPHELHPTRY